MKKAEAKKTEVVSLKIRVKGKEIDLTLEEAKELKDELEKVFAKGEKEYVPYYPYIPYIPYVPYQPYTPWWTTTDKALDITPDIWCGSTAGNITSCGGYDPTCTCDPAGLLGSQVVSIY